MALRETTSGELVFAPCMPVVDVETYDLLGDVGNVASKLHLAIVGILFDGIASQYYLLKESQADRFSGVVKAHLSRLPQPFAAFNCAFDRDVLSGNGCGDYVFKELQARGYERKQDAKLAVGLHYPDPYNGNGVECAREYAQYLRIDDRNCLERALQHNLCCLLTESDLCRLRGAGR